jgi:hypothetical protein
MIGGVYGAARLRRDSLRDALFAPFRSEVEWNVDRFLGKPIHPLIAA